ncbi:MAG: hypothetical protein UZ17_ACD001001527 [Acidobacteria bacterium OLB17]|nr:MAG: hypothetical protein UZ17_ACD001001527 [Acidobacteria bacterium OLB17]
MTVRHRKVSAHLKLVENLDSEITALAESLATPTTGRKGPKDSDILPPDDAFSFNDLGNADRFLQFAGDDLLYCVERKNGLFGKGRIGNSMKATLFSSWPPSLRAQCSLESFTRNNYRTRHAPTMPPDSTRF